MKRSLKIVALSLAFAIFMSGCFGSFGATRWIYGINDGVPGDSMGGKFLKTLVMWCLVVLPVYEIFMFGDYFILNTIEFFTGSPLIGAADYDVQNDGSVIVNFDNDSLRFVPVDETHMMIEHDGAIVGEAAKNDNSVTVTNFQKADVKTFELNAQM